MEEEPSAEPEKEIGGLEMDSCSMEAPTTKDEWQQIEATIDSGAAVCVFPRTLCTSIPVRPCEASNSGMTFRTASGERVAHEGLRTIATVTENGLTRRMTGAITSVNKVLLAVSRLAETGHRAHFTKDGGYLENVKDGTKIPMYQKNGVYMIKLWVKRSAGTRAREEVLASLSGGPRQACEP